MSCRTSEIPELSLAVDVTARDERWRGAAVRQVGRSVVRYGRESDLEVGFRARDGTRLRLLIKNKIEAAFQMGQVEAYRDRAIRYVEQGECDVAVAAALDAEAAGP
jgi:hypothetical protein